jgi:hypothetical protein
MSNTKLSVQQKQHLQVLRALNPNVAIFHFPEVRVCVAIRRVGEHMGEFSVAICAETETKYRKKVGELLARERMEYGQCLPVELGTNYSGEPEAEYLQMVAEGIATAVTG